MVPVGEGNGLFTKTDSCSGILIRNGENKALDFANNGDNGAFPPLPCLLPRTFCCIFVVITDDDVDDNEEDDDDSDLILELKDGVFDSDSSKELTKM